MAKLLLHGTDSGILQSVQTIAQLRGVGISEQKEIDSLAAMVKAIMPHKTLDELVLFFHGIPGGFTFDEEGYNLSDPEVQKAFAKSTTQITSIRFEGCWVGEAPDEMAKFGPLFKAKSVSGYTWARHAAEMNVGIPLGSTEKQLTEMLKHLDRWRMPPRPTLKELAEMAKQSSSKRLMKLEWFKYEYDTGKPPYGKSELASQTHFEKLKSHSYKKRDEAHAVTYSAAKAVRSQSPKPPFEHVTVTF